MFDRSKVILLCFFILSLSAGCSRTLDVAENGLPSSLKDVPAIRLNYVYEPDVPVQEGLADPASAEQINTAVLGHFENARTDEVLDRTLTSPDKKRILAVYHRSNDLPAEYRLDMYDDDGKLLKKVTADLMAVHFPDTIRWAPNSENVAFVAMLRGAQGEVQTPTEGPDAADTVIPTGTNSNAVSETNAAPFGNATADDTNANVDQNAAASSAEPTPSPPIGILTFRTEQIYLCDANGDNTKAITQNEGLIYFYYVWAPDSSMLAALAATGREWQYLQFRAESNGEIFVPVGRPRIVEKNGRERRLDDALTAVQPVWSPDSAKVSVGFDTQIRIYDSSGNQPTQAAIPLRNNLLISSQAFDREQQRKLESANGDQNTGAANTAGLPATLPDAASLVSFNPIVSLKWDPENIVYFQTAYIKRMKNEADNVTSFPRWHRVVLSPQAPAANK
jgi:hypothetical protein